MSIPTGMGHSGIVAIPIPPGGAPGDVLTKQSGANYDTYWTTGGSGPGGGGADAGLAGAALMYLSDPDSEDYYPISGERGPQGIQGPAGPQGSSLPVVLQPEDPEDVLVIPGERGPQGAAGSTGPAGVSPPPIVLQAEDPDDILVVPGDRGPAGATGATGATGPTSPPVVLQPEDPDDSVVIPGERGATGATGSTGPAGASAPPVVLQPEDPEDVVVVPGSRGADGAAGSAGAQGPAGPALFMLFDEPEPGERGPPGLTGPQGSSGGGGGSATTVEVNVSSSAIARGFFTITDAAITAASKLLVWVAPGPYTGKGSRADESEFYPIDIVSVVPASGSARVNWQSAIGFSKKEMPLTGGGTGATAGQFDKDGQGKVYGPWRRLGLIRGNVKFNYVVFS